MSAAPPVLTVTGFSVDYLVEPVVHAVRDVSLTLHRGEVLGLAGESGCGKSTLAYGIVRLLKPPAAITSGSAVFHGRDGEDVDWNRLDARRLRAARWDQVSMVFQGAMNSLNPVISIRAQMEDILTTHRPGMGRRERRARCAELLERVGVDAGRLTAYPHELSGGMRQRVMIAMAMALEPQVMIMDEPTTALDVVVQREILREIVRLRDELGFAVIFITHDLPLLLEISDRIAVMRNGEVVELADALTLYTRPGHEYTRRLLASFPSLTGDRGAFIRQGLDERLLALDAITTAPSNRDAGNHDTHDRDADNHHAGNRDTDDHDTDNRDADNHHAGNRDAEGRDADGHDTGNHDAEDRDTDGHDAGNRDADGHGVGLQAGGVDAPNRDVGGRDVGATRARAGLEEKYEQA